MAEKLAVLSCAQWVAMTIATTTAMFLLECFREENSVIFAEILNHALYSPINFPLPQIRKRKKEGLEHRLEKDTSESEVTFFAPGTALGLQKLQQT